MSFHLLVAGKLSQPWLSLRRVVRRAYCHIGYSAAPRYFNKGDPLKDIQILN